jgi:tRNA pseudouridine38-40 synthase
MPTLPAGDPSDQARFAAFVIPMDERPARRIRLTLAYDGTGFAGWQVQPDLPTIQGELERALTEIEGGPVSVAGSGRTDAGVHAEAQVAACTLHNRIPVVNLRMALNRLLPRSIRVLEAREVRRDFHPRFQAVSKTYIYRIWREEICPPLRRFAVYHYPYPLDEARMQALAPLFEGEHDFSAFAAADEKDALGQSKVRRIFSAGMAREGAELVFRVRGSGFLKHMVRMMTGTLIEAGKGNVGEADLRARLRAGFPGKAGPALPGRGLCLMEVEYPPGADGPC